ncbi:MAG: serine/threonine protein kinase [Deltaproteobacteria bacterium]|nr:serine/threonine protein kinase [Deltaproteobacteria bacterium]
MLRASALEAAVRDPALAAPGDSAPGAEHSVSDRRLTDSNQAWLGKIVDGRYRVIEVIGRGGMGVVYRVEHLRMGKIAAMKVLHRDLAQDVDVIARFEREAAAVSKLHHPHTVQVFDFGTAQGALYLIMELVRGLDLAHLIDRDGPMPWARAAPLLVQMCGALQEAHELGIVHRDLKPENVLITRTTGGRDYAKVLDFGLAKLDQRGTPNHETERQAIVGTPYFMAPEQIRGDEVDARTDLYSFGALMFELLTAQHLYVGSTAVGVLTKHLTADPDAPSMRAPKMGIPPAVDHLCRKALARDPEDRWQSAAELGAAIEEVFAETVGESTGPKTAVSRGLAGGQLVSDHQDSDVRLRRSDIDEFEASLKRRRWLVASVTGVLVLGGAAAAMWYVTRPAPTQTSEREPNDEPSKANRIAAGTKVTGYLGRRRSLTDGDRDVYRVDWPAGSKRVVSITVTGIPNLDINLSVNDGDGEHGATIDEGAIGEPEAMHRRSLDGPLLVTVGQTMGKDQRLPVENVSDPYTVTVTEEPPGGETEPNGMDTDANPLVQGEALSGYLDTRDDIDLMRWTGADGKYNVVVRADGMNLVWQTADGTKRTAGLAQIELHRNEIILLQRASKGPPANRGAMWSIVVTP